ncbi:CGNR zinc finger domain-containing protein [Micromonospora sp. NPDC023956]|uniref:CGNR zinc finger domain-containing protein n=1 Tax=Micromonospora sp. NPDC023956 TaxID=3155722 RepID=UPI0033DFDBE0
MHWIDVDGHPMPVLLAGHRGLELCNTWGGWAESPAPHREWLRDYDRLAVWAGHAHLLDAATVRRLRAVAEEQADAADRVLAETRTLRAALRAVLLTPGDTAAFDVVAAVAERAAAAQRLRADAEGARWTLDEAAGLALPLLACGRAAADLLTTADRPRIRACPGDDCGWLFVDPRGRRRWCSMAVCGNRAKVRAFASRQRRPAG